MNARLNVNSVAWQAALSLFCEIQYSGAEPTKTQGLFLAVPTSVSFDVRSLSARFFLRTLAKSSPFAPWSWLLLLHLSLALALSPQPLRKPSGPPRTLLPTPAQPAAEKSPGAGLPGEEAGRRRGTLDTLRACSLWVGGAVRLGGPHAWGRGGHSLPLAFTVPPGGCSGAFLTWAWLSQQLDNSDIGEDNVASRHGLLRFHGLAPWDPCVM